MPKLRIDKKLTHLFDTSRLPRNELWESFAWMEAPEFKDIDLNAGKNSIQIRGVAVRGGDISRNERLYTDEELKRAARTFRNTPITINHDMSRKVGNVIWAEYEDGGLEYLAQITRQPYVDMIRDGSANIRGVSIEAAYLYNRCPTCGEKFYNENDFYDHMEAQHFVKLKGSEVHGIIGQALSLVLDPELPGVEGTTLELVEIAEDPYFQKLCETQNRPKFKTFSQLLETVITDQKEREDYMKKVKGKAALREQDSITVDQAKQITPPSEEEVKKDEAAKDEQSKQNPPTHPVETEKPPEDETEAETEPESPTPTHTPPPEKIATEQESEIHCPEGFSHDADSKRCVPATIPETPPPVEAPVVSPPAEPEIKPTVTEQVEIPPSDVQGDAPVPHPVTDASPTCPPGSHLDQETGTCLPDTQPEEVSGEAPVEQTKVTTEITVPPLLKLGEPFANYTSFDDCVSKNPDKEDAEAYCADIKRKVEGETAEAQRLAEKTSPLLARFNRKHSVDNIRTAEAVNAVIKTVAEIYKEIRSQVKQLSLLNANINKTTKATITESKLRHSYDRGTLATTAKQLKQAIIPLQSQISQVPAMIKETTSPLYTNDKNLHAYVDKLCGNLATEYAKLRRQLEITSTKIATEQATIKQTIKKNKQDFEKLLAVADKNVLEYQEKVKTLEQRLKEQEEEQQAQQCPEGQHRDPETGQCVPDTSPAEDKVTETLKKLEETVNTRLDNIDDKFKGLFKGSGRKLKKFTDEEEEISADPLTEKM